MKITTKKAKPKTGDLKAAAIAQQNASQQVAAPKTAAQLMYPSMQPMNPMQ